MILREPVTALQRLEEDTIRISRAGDLAASISKRAGSLGSCYHEAGHVVIACLLRRFPVEARIERGDSGGGRVYFEEPTPEMDEYVLSDNDRIECIRITHEREGKPVDLEKLHSETEAMLYRSWDAVQAVAEELIDKHRLSGADIRRILAIAEPGLVEFWPEHGADGPAGAAQPAVRLQ